MDSLSLYLHIPFCKHRCAYCDFNTYTTVGVIQDAYVNALEHEITQIARLADGIGRKRPIRTVYFGGGTPSLLPIPDLNRLLSCVQNEHGMTDDIEITLEANPETVDNQYLEELLTIGVNRLSFGVQSAVPAELSLLERGHDMATVIHVVQAAQSAGFQNINLDLIYGLPNQTLQTWQQSLEAVIMLAPQHLSLYCLTIEEGTPMHRWLRNGRITSPDPDLAADQYQFACEYLAGKGYKHYEISNWSLPGFECRHNLTYWRNQDYLGLGAGAHGQAAGFRYALVRQPRVYIRRMMAAEAGSYPLSAAVAESHEVDKQEAMADTAITQLRLLREGLDLPAFANRFGQTFDDAYKGLPSQLIDWGLLEQNNDRLLLTERGRFISNQVFYRFV